MVHEAGRSPFAARLHFIPHALRRPQGTIVRLLRRYFQRAPGWVLLTTRGRKTGIPREVLLPCERIPDGLFVISTYGFESNWIRNIRKEPRVSVTCAGWVLPGRAEIIQDLDAKRSLVTEHPFFPVAPVGLLNFIHRTLLRRPWVLFLRWWVIARPVVVVHPDGVLQAGRERSVLR